MAEEPTDPLAEAVGRLVSRISRDPDVRQLLRGLAGLILDATEPPPATVTDEATDTNADADHSPTAPTPEASPVESPPPTPPPADLPAPDVPEPTAEPLRPLTLGQSPLAPEPPPPPKRDESDEDLEARDERELRLVPERCRLKAEGVRWLVERERRSRSGADLEDLIALDHDLIGRASELPGCYLWANHQLSTSLGNDPELAEELALAFEVSAEAAELVLLVQEGPIPDRPLLTGILQAAAEAQSALRVLVERAGNRWDSDQTALFHAIARSTKRNSVYIDRYMRIADPADPRGLPALSDRIRNLSVELDESRRHARSQKKRFNKVRYLSSRIADGDGTEEDWQNLAETIATLVDTGTPPSSPEIREYLIPILDDLPELGEVPRNFEFVLREVDRYLGGQSGRSSLPEPEDEAPIPEVAQVAELLRGRTVVFIANVANPEARDRLIRAFELADIDWIITREHQSISGFEPHVARPEVALVLLPIKWSSHSFGDVKRFCDRYDTSLVRLRAGYNPNMVAVQILAQASETLRSRRDAEEGLDLP